MIAAMLHYLGSGERFYAQRPLMPGKRRVWEFQAVVRGKIAPVFPKHTAQLRSSCMWVFGPDCSHGWDGESGKAAEVCVFQFATVPAPLQDAIGQDEHICIPLDNKDSKLLRWYVSEAQAELRQPTSLSLLRHQRLLLDLSLLVLGKLDTTELEPVSSAPRHQVDKAMAWFRSHLDSAPGQAEVAEAIACSPAHLRRLFHRVLGASPRDVLEQIRFQVACELLSDTRLSLDAVAEQCGLGSASAFSRAFSKRFQIAPSAWRAAQEQAHWNDGTKIIRVNG